MKYDDLPAALKRQVDKQIGKTPSRTLSDAEAKGPSMPYQCDDCPELFENYRAWDKHRVAVGHHHGRMNMEGAT